MKTVVLAYHDIGCACLARLLQLGADIPLVITHEDNPHENIWFGSVRDLARSHGIPTLQPARVNSPDVAAEMLRIKPDVLFSFYFRQILGEELLKIPRLGAFNLHGSLLPRYRGRCPVNWVLINGETETGVTLHRMDLKADSGAILAQRVVPIDFRDTALTLFRKMTAAAAQIIGDFYPQLLRGEMREIPQDNSIASYFGGRKAEDGRIDWTEDAVRIYNLVRAVTHPYPGAFTEAGGRKIFIWEAEPVDAPATGKASPGEIIASTAGNLLVAAGRGAIRIIRAQWDGAEEQDAGELTGSGGLVHGEMMG